MIDFDEGLLRACPQPAREELETEAEMLAGAFAGAMDPEALRRMAAALTRGRCETFEERRHARRLAALLRLRARQAGP